MNIKATGIDKIANDVFGKYVHSTGMHIYTPFL